MIEKLTMKQLEKIKAKKNYSVNLLELILIKKTMTFLLRLVKYITT